MHAMIDLSDGLGPDLIRLCEASGVAAEIEASCVPRNSGVPLAQALTDGEDFELLIAAAPEAAGRLLRWSKRKLRCKLTRIGRIVPRRKGSIVSIVAPQGVKVPSSLEGFQHF